MGVVYASYTALSRIVTGQFASFVQDLHLSDQTEITLLPWIPAESLCWVSGRLRVPRLAPH